jgi:hypothetical protein
MYFSWLDFLHGWLNGTTLVALATSLMIYFSKLIIASIETSLFIRSFLLGGGVANNTKDKILHY